MPPLGSASRKWISRGTLNRARRPRQNVRSSAAVSEASGLSTISAIGASPRNSSGAATTAHSRTAGWAAIATSISTDEMFSPPLMMMSLERSLMRT